ncbi:hypothetical protein [Streptomyces ipomoeae]|uniref:Uncharacterized protein n=1 Tax=Streptomyces ipomoeae 91-03 TaxID=698759 RepID=L1L7G0_9ACTN|nr:hypothetical protein [Streptomyces ipomoeae]EKX68635.1 hypothetical protein STRIP9103_05623 [Streptomyces ipomoeae 91-03]MDX2699249.1 hypothetical protein [Streptomyces ipomoeae]MDX2844778.1 hypothetical protein [Streptomyces ipomoeae]TQE18919.1 hypothetical protein Sipo7851_45260 [Streptomyces ipomoeae]
MTPSWQTPWWRQAGDGYRVRVVAHALDGRRAPLGEHRVRTPRLALRWLRGRAGDVADQLDPPYARVVAAWLGDTREHERALDLMTAGRPYLFLAQDEDGIRYAFTVEPLPLARPVSSPGTVRRVASCLAA